MQDPRSPSRSLFNVGRLGAASPVSGDKKRLVGSPFGSSISTSPLFKKTPFKSSNTIESIASAVREKEDKMKASEEIRPLSETLSPESEINHAEASAAVVSPPEPEEVEPEDPEQYILGKTDDPDLVFNREMLFKPVATDSVHPSRVDVPPGLSRLCWSEETRFVYNMVVKDTVESADN